MRNEKRNVCSLNFCCSAIPTSRYIFKNCLFRTQVLQELWLFKHQCRNTSCAYKCWIKVTPTSVGTLPAYTDQNDPHQCRNTSCTYKWVAFQVQDGLHICKKTSCTSTRFTWILALLGNKLSFYQPATHKAHGWLVLRLLCSFRICWYICASALITCAIITSRTLLPCDLTSQHRQFRRLLCVAAMSSLPQLRLRDGYREAEAM